MLVSIGLTCSTVTNSTELGDKFKQTLRVEGLKKAKMLLVHEINDGNIQAVHMLAVMLITGKFVNKNIQLAVED